MRGAVDLSVTAPAVPSPESPEDVTPEDLIPEVRQHARRRRARNLGVVLALAATVLGLIGLVGSGSPAGSRAGRSSPPASGATRTRARIVPLKDPSALAIGPNGELYVADSERQQILVRLRDGRFAVIAGTGTSGDSGDGGLATRAELRDPESLAIAPDGALYFAQYGTVRLAGGLTITVIREITPDGRIATVAGQHPNCHVVPATATSIPARFAQIDGAALSIGSDGRLDLSTAVCSNILHLGSFLQLLPSGRLVPTAADSVPKASGYCGGGITGRGFTVFGCGSGAGRGARLMVVRPDGSTENYPDDISEPDDMSSANGTVVVNHNKAIVKVTAGGLRTLATEQQIDDLLPGGEVAGPLSSGGIAVDRSGAVYSIESVGTHHGCISMIVRVSPSGAIRALWRSAPNQVCS